MVSVFYSFSIHDKRIYIIRRPSDKMRRLKAAGVQRISLARQDGLQNSTLDNPLHDAITRVHPTARAKRDPRYAEHAKAYG